MRTLSMVALAATALVVASPAGAQRTWSNGHWAPRTGGTATTPVIRNMPSTAPRSGGTHWNGSGGTRWNGSTHGGTRWNGGNHGGQWNGGGAHWGGTRWGNRIGGRWHAGVNAPGGWNSYRRPHRGWTLPSYWIAPSFFISDWSSWGLSTPPAGYHWSRYYDDAVLVDDYGRVSDYRDGIDWDRGYDDYQGGSDDYSYGEGSYSDSYAGGSGAAYGMSSGSDGYSYSSSQGSGYPPPPAGNCGSVYPAPPPGYAGQGCSTYSAGGYAPPVAFAPPAEQVQSYRSEERYSSGGYAGSPGPGCGNPCVVTTGGYYGGGYYGGGTTTTTVVINPAPVTTTTTVTEEVVEYAAPVRTLRRKARKVWRKPKPRCSCVCTTVCR